MPIETSRAHATNVTAPVKPNPSIGKSGKPKPKGNTSILSFFQRSEAGSFGNDASNLFVENKPRSITTKSNKIESVNDKRTTQQSNGSLGLSEEGRSRFNESPDSIKRRKTSHPPSPKSVVLELPRSVGEVAVSDKQKCNSTCTTIPESSGPGTLHASSCSEQTDRVRPNCSNTRRPGPFLDESDSEDEGLKLTERPRGVNKTRREDNNVSEGGHPELPQLVTAVSDASKSSEVEPIPSLKHESTSIVEADGFADFEGMEDFEDEYEEGEEYVERRYMQEQYRLEAEAGICSKMHDAGLADEKIQEEEAEKVAQQHQSTENEAISCCPICSVSFKGLSDQEASAHVNNCLDGNFTTLPDEKRENEGHEQIAAETVSQTNRLIRPPKPGQRNPFALGQSPGGGSAFSKLMSGHSEENAWAAAASSERDSRGRPSYQRTCPFYKILPGFFICVDAFRYGAVEGCNAYFLSHFHSDHYIGLTSSWSHGKIYCSHITANLVRQQLRVDPKWVVDLDWEQKVEVPGTQGVYVTMIPANHCPGSSLYLFEKSIDPPKNAPSHAKPRTQRVLHCGDFRACPAHIAHPQLAPETVDSITGKLRHQKIDVCYLDTTYLSPKYAFPSQEDVIAACADMCVSLSKEKVDEKDDYEIMKRERAGSAMTKFVGKDSKSENTDTESTLHSGDSTLDKQKKSRGQLLVVVGTYSIGKERICLGIARALDSLIYAPPSKQRICAALKDVELNKRLTSDPLAASVHMTPLFEIRAETLSEYLETYGGHFSRAVGFRPSGWNYRPPGSRSTEAPTVQQVLYSPGWKSNYSMKNLYPQRGSSSKAAVYGVPYSEHSSFRELSMFVCGLRIDKVIPTVNVGSAKSREKMRAWCERWAAEKRKNGLFRVKNLPGATDAKQVGEGGDFYPGKGTWELRTTL